MADKYKEFLLQQLETIKSADLVHANDIPNIDLYMDQVTTFMDNHLGLISRNNDGKTLTKTMINNYSKAGILPPSVKKKYNKDHMLMLIMIYNMKHVMTIPDIHQVLKPLQGMKEHSFESFYETLTDTFEDHFDRFISTIEETVSISEDLFENEEELAMLSTIYLLSMQAAVQKHLANKLIDEYLHDKEQDKNQEKKNEKKNDKKKDR